MTALPQLIDVQSARYDGYWDNVRRQGGPAGREGLKENEGHETAYLPR